MMYNCSIATIGYYRVYQNTLEHHQKPRSKPDYSSFVLSHSWFGLSLSPDLCFCASLNLFRFKTLSHEHTVTSDSELS